MRKVISLVLLVVSSLSLVGCTSLLNKNNKSGLQVLTNDLPAAVFLDDQYLDKTPYINKELKPGQYKLKIQPEDSTLLPYETTINLRKGLLTVVTWKPGTRPELSGGVIYELEKLSSKNQTELSVVSIPDGAIISVDEGEKDFSPVLTTDIKPGTHELSISLPSYETQQHTINMVAGHRLNVLVKLAKNPIAAETAATTSALTPAVATNSGTVATPSAKLAKPSASPSVPSSITQTITGSKITIKPTNFFYEGKEVLRVRDASGSQGKEIGYAPVGSQYAYLGETSQGWYKIQFNGQTGWVSAQYVTLQE